MRDGKRVAVVVPAFEEERLIARMILNLPKWVDRVVVVDDASRDGTSKAARATTDSRVVVLRHETNRGVGASIVTGYRAAVAEGADVIVVMAGDDQMDPSDLGVVVAPVVSGRADYVKGNRFAHALKRNMPFERRVAGGALSALTRATTRLAITDSQCGYTAISADAARALPLHDLWPRYGYPNDILALLSAAGLRVVEVPVRPVYADEASGVKPWHAAVVAFVILRRWWSTRASALPIMD